RPRTCSRSWRAASSTGAGSLPAPTAATKRSRLSQVSAPSYTEAMGKAEETKARVERAALTLFVARGVTETTTKEIAMAASIAEAMRAGEIPRRNADLAAASAVGVVLQAATYKVYGRFTGNLAQHVRFFADAAWAVLSTKEK